jgi:hypothetical protein
MFGEERNGGAPLLRTLSSSYEKVRQQSGGPLLEKREKWGTRPHPQGRRQNTLAVEAVSGGSGYRTNRPVKEKVSTEHDEPEHCFIQQSGGVR